MLYRTTNSLVYSVSYENYQNKILEDKENKTQGNWNISKDKIPHLKYAYVYLKNSNKMIVKKYKILHFERNKPEKGYDDIEKQCFVFTESEDVFFEYPHSVIQGRHYRNDVEMDDVPRLPNGEIERRLHLSKITKDTSGTGSNPKKIVEETDPKKRLRNVWREEFTERPLPPVDVAIKMIESVELDPEQDLVALLDEYYTAEDNKNSK